MLKPIRKLLLAIFCLLWFLPSLCMASFIETTMGTAVVNDATASYFNPAALVLLKNSQIIPLGTVARFRTQFSGQTTAVSTGFNQSGTSSSNSNYYSPSLYFGMPVNNRITLGLAGVSNFANRNPEENSILRYVQSGNSIQDYDLVPAIAVKLTDSVAVGGGVNFSYTSFDLHPIIGFPGSNIPDAQAHNQSNGSGIGFNVGFLLKPTQSTLIGFNYRTVTTYNETGKSTFNGLTNVVSNNYRFQMRTPAHTTLTLSQMLTPAWGLIATVQRIQWSIIRNINIYGIANAIGTTPVIVNASVPYHLHNSWLLTLGANYKFNPQWVLRVAGTYNQSPDNGFYQISTGDSFILGGSLGYQFNKTFTVDAGYAHAFIRDQNINVNGVKFLVNGVNRASRDVVSLKVTVNV